MECQTCCYPNRLLLTIDFVTRQCKNLFHFIYSYYVCKLVTMIKWEFACILSIFHKSLFDFIEDWFNVTIECEIHANFKNNIICKYASLTIILSHFFYIIEFQIVLSFASFFKKSFYKEVGFKCSIFSFIFWKINTHVT